MAVRLENTDLTEILRVSNERALGISLAKMLLVFLINLQVAAAPAVSPQMIEQLRGLPVSEQERVARQLGVDVSSRGMNTRGVRSDNTRSNLRDELLDVARDDVGVAGADRAVHVQ